MVEPVPVPGLEPA